MAIFNRKRRPEAEESGPAPRAVMAAAVPLTGPEAKRYATARAKQTAEQWQKDAWYYYDAIGELSAPTNWIANAVSKADLFGAELDPSTGLVTGPTENVRAQQAAALCLGGAAKRAQLQFVLAVCWQIPGEAYVVVRGRAAVQGVPQPDEWLVLSGQKVNPKGTVWTYEDPVTLEWITLGSSDRLIRIWSPHPNDQSKANSAVRAALSVLREIEKASMNLAAVLDSRIASNGVWVIPQEIDLPGRGDDETNAERFSDMLLEAAAAGIAAPGTAAAQVPVIAEVPLDMIEALVAGRMYPQTDMDQTVITLRQDDMARLASALDMPKETAEGSMAGMNHWGSWQVEETTYKLFIEPLLDRVGDALTEFWYRPVLRAMGVDSPERHTLAWDTTGIVSRPDSTEDMNWLYENGLISDDYRRQVSGVPEDAVPDDDESRRRFLEKVVLASPQMLETAALARELGLGAVASELESAAEQQREESAARLEAVREQPQTEENTGGRALPAAPASTDDVPDGLVAAAELIVFDALSRAGGRLLTREHRGQFSSTPRHELHTVIACADVPRVLADSFQFTDRVATAFGRDPEELERQLVDYSCLLITSQRAHNREWLRTYLRGTG
jgi:hypothetical protein